MLFKLASNNLPKFIFSPLAQENFMGLQCHEAQIMNKINL